MMDASMIAAIIAGVAALGGVTLEHFLAGWREARQGRRLQEERERAELDRWRDKSADAIAAAREFLADAIPTSLLVNITEERAGEIYSDLQTAWGQVRIPLSVVAAGHPSKAARELADELGGSLRRLLNREIWLLADILKERSSAAQILEAEELWSDADALAGRLREALHKGDERAFERGG